MKTKKESKKKGLHEDNAQKEQDERKKMREQFKMII